MDSAVLRAEPLITRVPLRIPSTKNVWTAATATSATRAAQRSRVRRLTPLGGPWGIVSRVTRIATHPPPRSDEEEPGSLGHLDESRFALARWCPHHDKRTGHEVDHLHELESTDRRDLGAPPRACLQPLLNWAYRIKTRASPSLGLRAALAPSSAYVEDAGPHVRCRGSPGNAATRDLRLSGPGPAPADVAGPRPHELLLLAVLGLLGPLELVGHRGDHHPGCEQQPGLQPERGLVVQQLLPPPAHDVFGDVDRDDPARVRLADFGGVLHDRSDHLAVGE